MATSHPDRKLEVGAALVSLALLFGFLVWVRSVDSGWRRAIATWGALFVYGLTVALASVRTARGTPPRHPGFPTFAVAAALATAVSQGVQGVASARGFVFYVVIIALLIGATHTAVLWIGRRLIRGAA